MYSDVFCEVYNAFGWNYYPEIFGQQLLKWLKQEQITVTNAMDLACGTGCLCRILKDSGIQAAGMDFSSGMIEIARRENPDIPFCVADMTVFCPEERYDLVTCTGDAINHIPALPDVEKIFRNVSAYLSPGGYFVFDILNEREVSTSEPFEMPWGEQDRIWFQMTRPDQNKVNLKIRYFSREQLKFEENIRETIHDPKVVCDLLEKNGFRLVRCADSLLNDGSHGTTWFVIAQKSE